MGKKRIAQTLARAGLHLGVTTVGRILKESEDKRPELAEAAMDEASVRKVLLRHNPFCAFLETRLLEWLDHTNGQATSSGSNGDGTE